MRTMLIAMSMLISMIAFAATPTITSVTAQQRYPWNGKVDISYTVTGDIAAEAKQRALITSLKVTANDKVANKTYTATKVSGDMTLTAGTHKFVWDLDAEGLAFKSSNVVFTVSCETTPALYCVIDLSAGSSASSYPVTYLAEPPSGGFNVDLYKTTKLVLRRIEPGKLPTRNARITKPFFCGVFEVTQKQYKLIMGSNPSYYGGDKRPVDNVSYNTLRGSSQGAKWPASSGVDASSFLGKLRTRTNLNYDLPTEAQWEFACRAGTTSSYNNGGSSESDLNKLGRYNGGTLADGKGGYSNAHTTVGSYQPNSWGLYDMHGNVKEWCLDWYGSSASSGNDPVGPSSVVDSWRVCRGGSFSTYSNGCTSSSRDYNAPTYTFNNLGFRIFRTLSN